MSLGSRKVMDRAFTGAGVGSIVLVAAAILVLLGPITWRGAKAFVFRGTVEHRRLQFEQYGVGDADAVRAEVRQFATERNALYARVADFRAKAITTGAARFRLPAEERERQQTLATQLDELEKRLTALFGPERNVELQMREVLPPAESRALRASPGYVGDPDKPIMPRDQYGATRWDRAQAKLHAVLYREAWVPPEGSDGTQQLIQTFIPRQNDFAGTELAGMFDELPALTRKLLNPRWTFYWRFLTQDSLDAHMFGGIWAEVLGTIYLTLGAILFAVPMGIISAVYLVEYARDTWYVGVLRSCVSTLAGVPSIVFGLFGLAFFINSLHVSRSPSVLAGALTLAVLILPIIIRASEEALRAVPLAYKAAALSMGASKWRTIVTVILPAALPGILTGIVISMGRAAGETAPIIFTAAASAGGAVAIWDVASERTPALPWNVYNLATEHAAVEEIRHVQYGMVLTLVLLVLLLNGAAIVMRARIARRLAG